MPKVTEIPAKKQVGSLAKKKETRKLRVAAYCRVSTDYEEQASSYQMQIQHYEEAKVMVNANCFLGYDKDEDGHLVVNPEQAEIVKRIFREYQEGASCQQIARGLEHDGVLTARGNKRWHDSGIRRILENEKYMGERFYRKHIL